MRHSGKRYIAAALVGLMLVTNTAAAPTDATVQSYEKQIAELATQQQEALDRLNAVRGDYADAALTKSYYDEVIALSLKKKDLAQLQLDAITQQITETEAAIAKAEADIEKQEKAFDARMVTLYEEGEASVLELLLGAQSLTDLLTRIDMALSIQTYDKQVITSLEDAKVALAENKEKLEDALQLQQEAQATLEADIKTAQTLADESLAYMESLQQNESALLTQYYSYREAEEALDKELTTYLAELQAKQKTAYVGGSLGWPLPTDVQYYVSSEYGYRVLNGVQEYHYGIDLACACNTAIYAANAGTVVTSGTHWSYGEYVVIDHGGGQATLYAHMNQRKVSVGETVEKGQLIGLVGMTGSASGYHLHFEVRLNGAHTEPRNYIVLP